ncbi:hypothetical protein WME90_02030 [Sorangium sp. So ce375]|uniref:hypothetical protein n=1 Tax=Sorangium sp. So ce375 TaxID=3133306 RepID=UPI003F5B5F5F
MVSKLSDLTRAPTKRVIAIVGDSNFVGYGASLDMATGWRATFQRVLREEGVDFRMVGRGYGALNGTGTTWGRFPVVDDFHDAPANVIGDWRNNGFSGRRLSLSNVATSVDANADTITAPGHTLTNGMPFTLTSPDGQAPTLSVAQPIYWACGVSGNTFQAAQYEGSSTPLDITDAGSGTIKVNEGLIEMWPNIVASWDTTPTDIIVGGGTNDIINLIGQGYSVADTLAILQQRERAYERLISGSLLAANKFRWQILDFAPGMSNYASCSAVAQAFNAWMRSRIRTLTRWTFVEFPGLEPADYQGDYVHPLRHGYQIMGQEGARAFVEAVGPGLAGERFPQPFVRRPAQACVELRATTDRITIPAQASINPGSDSFFFAIWFMPFALGSSTNVLIQQENPYTNGGMLAVSNNQFALYWKNSPSVLPVSNYTALAKLYRWHRLFVFCDFKKQEAALTLNGRLVQRVLVSAGAITSSTGWTVGGVGLTNTAPGLYQQLLFGHGANLDIEDALRMAQRDYLLGEDPDGTTNRFPISEGTGTSIAGTLPGSTAGTLSVTTGSWVASGRYEKPCDQSYRVPDFDQRIATVTATYTATYGELVKCDPTSAGFTVNLPTAAGHEGERILVSNVTSSTNAITVDGAGSETIDGATTATINTAYGDLRIISDGANWVVV